jgi:hypothetical protein
MASSGPQRSYERDPYINAPALTGPEYDAIKTPSDGVLVYNEDSKSVVVVPLSEFGL